MYVEKNTKRISFLFVLRETLPAQNEVHNPCPTGIAEHCVLVLWDFKPEQYEKKRVTVVLKQIIHMYITVCIYKMFMYTNMCLLSGKTQVQLLKVILIYSQL